MASPAPSPTPTNLDVAQKRLAIEERLNTGDTDPRVDQELSNPTPSPSPSPSPQPTPTPAAEPQVTAQPDQTPPELTQHQKDLEATTLAPTPEQPTQETAPADQTPPELKAPLGKPPPEIVNDIAQNNDKEGIFNLHNQGQIDKVTAREALKARTNIQQNPVQTATDALVNGITAAPGVIGGGIGTTWQAFTDFSPTNPLYQFGAGIGNAGNEIRILAGPEMQNQAVASDLQDRLNAAKKAELANVPPEIPDAQQSIEQKYATQQGLVDQIKQFEQKNGYGEQSADKAQELARMTAIEALDPNYLATRKQQAVNHLVSGGLLGGVELGQAAQGIAKYAAPAQLMDLANHYLDTKKTDADWDKELDYRKGINDWTNQVRTGTEKTVSGPVEQFLTGAAGSAENPFGIGPGGTSTTGLQYMSPEELTAKGEAPSPEKIADVSQAEQLAALTAVPEFGLGEAIEGAATGLLKTGAGVSKGMAAAIGAGTKVAGQAVKKFGSFEALQSIPELISHVGGGAAVGGAVHGLPGAAVGGIAAGTHYLLKKVAGPLLTYAAAKQVQRVLEFTGNTFAKAAADSYTGKGLLSNLAGWGVRQGTEGAFGILPFAATAKTPEEFGSNIALGSIMHLAGRAPGAVWGATGGPYFDSLFKSVPTKGVPAQKPVAYGTMPAADAVTAAEATKLPPDLQQKFYGVQNLMQGTNEVHIIPAQGYDAFRRLIQPTGELPNTNGFWLAPENNPIAPGTGMSFIRSDRVQEALVHEGMGHPIYHSLPDDTKTLINRASLDPLNGDLNDWTKSYFGKFGNPDLKGITYDSLPTRAEVNAGDPAAIQRSTAALGYTKDDIMAERGAELLGKVMDGVPIDKLTSEPGNARLLKYGIGKMFEFWGIPTVTPQSESILGVNPSLSGALALEDYMRNFARNRAAGKPGAQPGQAQAGANVPTPPSTPPDVTNRQYSAIASGVAGAGTPQAPVSNLGTPNVPTPQPQKQQPQAEPTKEEAPPIETQTPGAQVPEIPPVEVPHGEIPETRKPGALIPDERSVVYNRVMRREGATDEQGGQGEMYGFRTKDDPEAYQAISAARAQYGQGSPQELEVVHKALEAEAAKAGIDQFQDPGLQSVVASMAHMRGPEGSNAILNAAIDGKIEQTAQLKPETVQALNNMSPEEAQARIRQAREEYDRRVYGHTTTTKGGRTGNWWDTYGNGLLRRYDEEAKEGLEISKGSPDAYREELDAHRTYTSPTETAETPPKIPNGMTGPVTSPEEVVNAKGAIQSQSPADDELARQAAAGNKAAEEILRDNYGANWLSKVSQDARNEYGNAYPEESTRQNVGIIGQRDTGTRVLDEQAKVLKAIQEQGGLPSANALTRTGTYLEPNAEDLRDLHEQINRLTDQEKQYLKDNYGITPQKLFKNNAPNSETVNANLTRQGVSNFGTPNDLINHIYDTLSNMRQVMAGRPVLRQEGGPNVPRGTSVEQRLPQEKQPATEQTLNQAADTAQAAVPTQNKRGQDRTGTQAYQEDVNQARMEGMLAAHAATLGPEDTQVRMYKDPDTGKVSAVGNHIDTRDPMNRILMQGVPRDDIDVANRFGAAIGTRTPLDITHYGAERGTAGPGDSRRRTVRQAEQAESPAAERIGGEAPAEAMTKTIIPTRIEVAGLRSGEHRIMLRGISPDKLADNVRKIQEALPKEHGAKGLTKEELGNYVRDYIANHQHGYSGAGDRALLPESQLDPTYSPHPVPKAIADTINMAFGDTGAKAKTEKGARARQLAVEGKGYLNEGTGEVNPLREQLDTQAQKTQQSLPSLDLESPYESILAKNVLAFHASRGAPANAYPERIREAGGELSRHLQEGGFPNPQFIKAGFMPDVTGEPTGRKAERIDGPAVKMRGKIYTGDVHDDAGRKALADKMGSVARLDTDPAFAERVERKLQSYDEDQQPWENGFVTSSGRFVNRDEALKIARDMGQVRRTGASELNSMNLINPNDPFSRLMPETGTAPLTEADRTFRARAIARHEFTLFHGRDPTQEEMEARTQHILARYGGEPPPVAPTKATAEIRASGYPNAWRQEEEEPASPRVPFHDVWPIRGDSQSYEVRRNGQVIGRVPVETSDRIRDALQSGTFTPSGDLAGAIRRAQMAYDFNRGSPAAERNLAVAHDELFNQYANAGSPGSAWAPSPRDAADRTQAIRELTEETGERPAEEDIGNRAWEIRNRPPWSPASRAERSLPTGPSRPETLPAYGSRGLDFQSPEEKQNLFKTWHDISKDDEAFKFPTPESGSLEDIGKAYSTPGNPVELTPMHNGAWLRVKNARTGGYITVHDVNGEPSIDAMEAGSKGKKGAGGTNLYQAAFSWAQMNGKTIHGGALTDVNQLRRTSNMLSSALRHGDTDQFTPGAGQDLDWRKEGGASAVDTTGNVTSTYTKPEAYEHNVAEMARQESNLAYRRVPGIGSFKYDLNDGTFKTQDGQPATDADIESAIRKSDPGFGQGVGLATAKRALVTRAALENVREGQGEPGGTALQSPGGPGANLKRILYQPETGEPVPGQREGLEDRLHPSTVPIMRGEEDVPDQKRTVPQVAKFLSQRAKDMGMTNDYTPEMAHRISDAMADEVEHAFKGQEHGADWYDKDIKEAMGYVQKMHPEIETDPDARRLFTSLLAIPSNGQKVEPNAYRAIQLYEGYKKNGKIETDSKWGGKESDGINAGLSTLQSLIDAHGLKNAMDFLDSKLTVREIAEAGKKLGLDLDVGGEHQDTEVKGAMIFGPKLGSFYTNLNGDFSTTTMDRWFMRSFNRYNGTLTDANVGAVPKQAARVIAAADDAPKIVKKQLTKMVDNPPASWDDVPDQTKEYITEKFNSFQKSGFKEKTEIHNSVKRLYDSYNEINQAPGNGTERNWIRSVVAQAQDKLKSKGIDLSNAANQAVLWYYEKNLYRMLGARVNENSPNYSAAFKKIYDERSRSPEK